MRPKFMVLSTVTHGSNSPGWNLNICLCLLIDELKQLWSFRVLTYDVSRNKIFR
jgi:hypothetical protein